MGVEKYVQASIPEPYTVLGLRLRPFSLGHYFLLHRFGCAFGSDVEAKVGLPDLILALAICSRSYDEFLTFIQGDDFEPWLRTWGRAVLKHIKRDKLKTRLQRLGLFKKYEPFNILEKFVSFNRYMSQGCVVPRYWENNASGEESGAHWSQNVLVCLTGSLGYTQSEALNMPLSKALADYFKHIETEGGITFMTDEEIEAVEASEKAETQNKEATHG